MSSADIEGCQPVFSKIALTLKVVKDFENNNNKKNKHSKNYFWHSLQAKVDFIV